MSLSAAIADPKFQVQGSG